MSFERLGDFFLRRGLEGDADRALKASKEGLQLIAPFVENMPQAFGVLAQNLVRAYIAACQKAGIEPDHGLLQAIAQALGLVDGERESDIDTSSVPDQLVHTIFANAEMQPLLVQVMQQNNLGGDPRDLPFDVQRAIVVALIQAGAIQLAQPDTPPAAQKDEEEEEASRVNAIPNRERTIKGRDRNSNGSRRPKKAPSTAKRVAMQVSRRWRPKERTQG